MLYSSVRCCWYQPRGDLGLIPFYYDKAPQINIRDMELSSSKSQVGILAHLPYVPGSPSESQVPSVPPRLLNAAAWSFSNVMPHFRRGTALSLGAAERAELPHTPH